jgi:DNA-binding MarR family transcriptional regulator
MSKDIDLQQIEAALVALRRRQTRRVLAAQAGWSRTALVDVLDVLEAAETDHVPATVVSVAEALHVDQPRASKLVTAAVDAGLVRREADQSDGRRSLLVRTPAGCAQSQDVHASRRQAFARAMVDWSDADRAIFARLLWRFLRGLGEQPSERGGQPEQPTDQSGS